jgi:hypothetical protein
VGLLADLRANAVTLAGFVSASVATQCALYLLSPSFARAPATGALVLLVAFGAVLGLISTVYHLALLRERQERLRRERDARTLRAENRTLARLFRGVARERAARPRPPPVVGAAGAGTYVVHHKAAALHIFATAVGEGQKGLVLSRHPPAAVWEQIGVPGVPVIWLSGSKAPDSTPPTSLDLIFRAVRGFRQLGGDLILVDALEYLVVHNEFAPVLKLVHAMQDEAAQGGFRILLHVNPDALDAQRLALLSRDCVVLRTPPPEYVRISP